MANATARCRNSAGSAASSGVSAMAEQNASCVKEMSSAARGSRPAASSQGSSSLRAASSAIAESRPSRDVGGTLPATSGIAAHPLRGCASAMPSSRVRPETTPRRQLGPSPGRGPFAAAIAGRGWLRFCIEGADSSFQVAGSRACDVLSSSLRATVFSRPAGCRRVARAAPPPPPADPPALATEPTRAAGEASGRGERGRARPERRFARMAGMRPPLAGRQAPAPRPPPAGQETTACSGTVDFDHRRR